MSSRRHQRRLACQGKRRYSNQTEAVGRAIGLSHHVPGDIHAYRCPHCGGWHVGHRENARRRTRSAGHGGFGR